MGHLWLKNIYICEPHFPHPLTQVKLVLSASLLGLHTFRPREEKCWAKIFALG